MKIINKRLSDIFNDNNVNILLPHHSLFYRTTYLFETIILTHKNITWLSPYIKLYLLYPLYCKYLRYNIYNMYCNVNYNNSNIMYHKDFIHKYPNHKCSNCIYYISIIEYYEFLKNIEIKHMILNYGITI